MAGATQAILRAPMKPFVVSTPCTRPATMRKPVTSQFWMMSTPRSSAARAKPQATASWRAVAAAALQRGAEHRVAGRRRAVEDRQNARSCATS